MSIHASDPFATPEYLRSPVRRLRGRLPAAVTLWTAVASGGAPAGLTVSSTLVVDGDPGRLLGVLDEESDLWAAVQDAGRFAVVPLTDGDRQLADRFAGLLPAPGGPFADGAWRDHGYGPVPAGHAAWAGCRLDGSRPLGWGLLVEATIERVELTEHSERSERSQPVERSEPSQPSQPVESPLLHYRGRYHTLPITAE